MTSSAERPTTRQYAPPYGMLKRRYEVAIIAAFTIAAGVAGYLYLDGVVDALLAAIAGSWLARGFLWVIYYFVEGKKRPWQFDLRTAFFVMTLAAVLLTIVALLLNEKA